MNKKIHTPIEPVEFLRYRECPKKWYYYHVYERTGGATFIVHMFYATLFVGGIVLTGSDGLWFPVPNIVGLGMLAIFAITRWTKRTK